MDNQVFTYFQERSGFSYFYPKRRVLEDGGIYDTTGVMIFGRKKLMQPLNIEPVTSLDTCRVALL
jgi:hypothetical protein